MVLDKAHPLVTAKRFIPVLLVIQLLGCENLLMSLRQPNVGMELSPPEYVNENENYFLIELHISFSSQEVPTVFEPVLKLDGGAECCNGAGEFVVALRFSDSATIINDPTEGKQQWEKRLLPPTLRDERVYAAVEKHPSAVSGQVITAHFEAQFRLNPRDTIIEDESDNDEIDLTVP